MANTIERPPVLPSVGQFPAAVVLKSEEYALIPETLNYCIAELHAEQAFQQSFYDNICSASTTSYGENPVCRWCVPIISDMFNTIRIYVRGYFADAGLGGDVEFKSVGNDADVSIELPADDSPARSDFTLVETLDISAIDEDGYDLIEMRLKVDNDAGRAIIEQVFAEYVSRAEGDAALDAQEYDGVYGMGVGASAFADAPLTASRGFQIIDVLQSLVDRPRCFLSISALHTDYYEPLGYEGGFDYFLLGVSPALGPWMILHGNQITTEDYWVYAESATSPGRLSFKPVNRGEGIPYDSDGITTEVGANVQPSVRGLANASHSPIKTISIWGK